MYAQDASFSDFIQNNIRTIDLPYIPGSNYYWGYSNVLPLSQFRIPLYKSLDRSVVTYADDPYFPPMLSGFFSLPAISSYLFLVYGEDSDYSTEYIYLTDQTGSKQDSLEVSATCLKSLAEIRTDGTIVLDSLDAMGASMSIELFLSSGISIPGRRIRKIYSIQNGKIHLSQSIYYVPALYNYYNLTGLGTGPLSRGNEAIDHVE